MEKLPSWGGLHSIIMGGNTSALVRKALVEDAGKKPYAEVGSG
jgi:hypothetical protein